MASFTKTKYRRGPRISAVLALCALIPYLTTACNLTITAQEGDTCASLASTWGITVTAFIHNNPSIKSCSKLTVGSSYCIDTDPGPPSLTSAATATKPTKGGSSPASTTKVVDPSAGLVISSDATCGNGITCLGSKFGDCCSGHGWCGSSPDHCGQGCQSAFGSCAIVSGNTSIPSPPPSTFSSSASPLPNSFSPTGLITITHSITQVMTTWTTITATQTQTQTQTSVQTSIQKSIQTTTQTQTSIITATRTETALSTISTVLTSTVATQTQVLSITKTITSTKIDTSVITTITTVTLVMSFTDKERILELCSRTLAQHTSSK